MKHKGILKMLVLGVMFLIHPSILLAQSVEPGVEVQLQNVNFPAVKEQLFGNMGTMGLLNGTAPFELQAQGVVFTQANIDAFFPAAPPTCSPTAPCMDFVTLVTRVQQLPGTEVKIQGMVSGGTPFQLKVEAGEVKIQGLTLTQDQFNTLRARLQATAGIREFKIDAIVNGQRMVAKFENEGGKIETKVETKDKSRGRAEDKRHRGEEGTSASLNNTDRDQGKDLDHSIRGRERAVLEGEKAGRSDPPERLGRVRRDEMIEKLDRPERIDRAERPQRMERMERPQRMERVERPEHRDR